MQSTCQTNTLEAIERLQEFIEDYPISSNIELATEEISSLRLKLAKKDFESARLYLKLEEYDSALIYLNNVLAEYYDTNIIDEVRITIVFVYLLQNKSEMATSYLENQEHNFISKLKFEEGRVLIDDMKILQELVAIYFHELMKHHVDHYIQIQKVHLCLHFCT